MNKDTQYTITVEVKKAVTPEQYLKWLLDKKDLYRRLAANERQELAKTTLRKQKKAKEYDSKADEYVKTAMEVAAKHKLSV